MTLAHQHKYTYDDYARLPDQPRVELINGEFLVAPSPFSRHQRVSGRIQFRLTQWVQDHDLGEVFYAPLDVILSRYDVVQPDILFVAKKRLEIIKNFVEGPPDLVVEVLSLDKARDRVLKKHLYEREGVREYWIVDADRETVSILQLKGKKFHLHKNCGINDFAESTVVRGFKLRIKEIFKP